jgi:hypothetical protein
VRIKTSPTRSVTPSKNPPQIHYGTRQKTLDKNCAFFCAFGFSSYNDHDNLDHGYIVTCYLDTSKATQELPSTASVSSLASTTLPL